MCSTNAPYTSALECRGLELLPVLTSDRNNNWTTIYSSAFKSQNNKWPLCCSLWYGLLFFESSFVPSVSATLFCLEYLPLQSTCLSWPPLTFLALVSVWVLPCTVFSTSASLLCAGVAAVTCGRVTWHCTEPQLTGPTYWSASGLCPPTPEMFDTACF